MKRGNIGILIATAAYLTYKVIESRKILQLKGKIVLITGGSRGLGLVLARQLSKQGADVIICARQQDTLDKAVDQVSALGGKITAFQCDVSNKAAVEKLIDEVTAKHGKIDVLINNAGVIQVGPERLMRTEEYQEALDINLWGAIHTTLAVLPHMRTRKQGHIVNITSIGAKVSVPHLLPYSVSKFAMAGFSEGLNASLKEDNVQVTTVYPGLMRTGSHHHIEVFGDKSKEFSWFSILGTHPLLSVRAEKAASIIINAFCRGKNEVIISVPAKIAIKLKAMCPGLISNTLSAINYLLPSAKGPKGDKSKGYESHSQVAPSILTVLGEKAALSNNQL
jgi:short-subunit dehydrogenase